MALKTYYERNTELPLIKLHYFFFFGGLGGYIPYRILLGRSLNINATAIGFLSTTLKCLLLFSKPLVGSLVDYYRNIKLFLMGLIVVVIITGLSFLLIPPIDIGVRECANKKLENSSLSEDWSGPQSTQAHEDCQKPPRENCTFSEKIINLSEPSAGDGVQWKAFESKNLSDFQFPTLRNGGNINSSLNFELQPYNKVHNNLTKTVLCESEFFNSKCEPKMQSCQFTNAETMVTVYKSYIFWVFALLFVLSGIAYENACSLGDIACYEMLGSQKQLYGSQRLFGTIGWAIICILIGFLNEISSEYSAKKDFSPGIYLMGILLVIDFLIVSKITVAKSKVSKDISGDLKKVMRSGDIILFSVGAIAIGILSSTVSNFEFWYLQDLGASQTLMWTTVFVQCLIEIPFFRFSAWIVQKFGSFNCLVLSFGAFVIRCGLYYSIHNPWWALAIDTTHGMTFALFHFCMTNFAAVNAPEGTEATVLGILSGLTTGLGAATGNLLSGVALDKYGSRLMFCFASVFSAACAICFAIIPRILIRNTSSKAPYEYKTATIGETII